MVGGLWGCAVVGVEVKAHLLLLVFIFWARFCVWFVLIIYNDFLPLLEKREQKNSLGDLRGTCYMI